MNLNRCISLKVGNEQDMKDIYTKHRNISWNNESNIYGDAALH